MAFSGSFRVASIQVPFPWNWGRPRATQPHLAMYGALVVTVVVVQVMRQAGVAQEGVFRAVGNVCAITATSQDSICCPVPS